MGDVLTSRLIRQVHRSRCILQDFHSLFAARRRGVVIGAETLLPAAKGVLLRDYFPYLSSWLEYETWPYNNPPSERSVEVSIALSFLSERVTIGRLLEIGNVLENYPRATQLVPELAHRTVLDKYEKRAGIWNADIFDLSSADPYDTIISISTIEHVGQGREPTGEYGEAEEAIDFDAPLHAIAKIYECLSAGGEALVTVPFGADLDYRWFRQFGREALGELFVRTSIPRSAVEITVLKAQKIHPLNPRRIIWNVVEVVEAMEAQYNTPFAFANAIAVIYLRKI